MNIKLVGAFGGNAIGSADIIRTMKATILFDAGMLQGGGESEAKNCLPTGVRPERIDARLPTHPHLDHKGCVPLLINREYGGPVFAVGATIDLAELILKDSARISPQDAERRRRKGVKRGQTPVDPLYSPEDVAPFQALSRPIAPAAMIKKWFR